MNTRGVRIISGDTGDVLYEGWFDDAAVVISATRPGQPERWTDICGWGVLSAGFFRTQFTPTEIIDLHKPRKPAPPRTEDCGAVRAPLGSVGPAEDEA